MTKPTFKNLNLKKKENFLKDAFSEFALRGFWGASLTRLVKSLGIAKGSIYQYFENKEDLYHYLLGEACRQKAAIFEVLNRQSGKDYSLSYLIISARYDLTFPQHSTLIYQAFSTFHPSLHQIISSELIAKTPADSNFDPMENQTFLIGLSSAIFSLLLLKSNISVEDYIAKNEPVELPGSIVAETVQECLNQFK